MIYWLMPLVWFVLVVGSGAILVFTRPRRRSPKPNYARIAELERELGFAEPLPSTFAGLDISAFAELLAQQRAPQGRDSYL